MLIGERVLDLIKEKGITQKAFSVFNEGKLGKLDILVL